MDLTGIPVVHLPSIAVQFFRQRHLLFCHVHCVNTLWGDALLDSDLEAVDWSLCYVQRLHMFPALWNGTRSWWEHLLEDLEETIVKAQRCSLQRCVGMWRCSNRAYLAVRHRVGANKLFQVRHTTSSLYNIRQKGFLDSCCSYPAIDQLSFSFLNCF